jgi:GTP-sensing pleiotropic transcriptional regulator CodY
MDGISNLVGERKISITLKGVEYELSTLKLTDIADCERFILDSRPSIGQAIADAKLEAIKDDRQREHIRELIVRERISKQTVSQQETDDFLNTARGLAWTIFTASRGKYPELSSLELVVSLLSDITTSELMDAVKVVSRVHEKDILPN